jgi:hypothetical protein
MDASEELVDAAREHEEWLGRTEELLLRYDALMFPGNTIKVVRFAGIKDMRGAIRYYNEEDHEAYFFNPVVHLESIENTLKQNETPSEKTLLEVDRMGAILSASAVRLRACKIYAPPLRSFTEVVHDDRIPWPVKVALNQNPTIKRYAKGAKGELNSLYDGIPFAVSFDLAVVGKLASHAFRNDLPIEWLRPFILA